MATVWIAAWYEVTVWITAWCDGDCVGYCMVWLLTVWITAWCGC